MTMFRPDMCATALVLCRRGASDMELAAALSCSLRDVKIWQAKYPQFADACRVGSEEANERVKRALYNRAVGYHYETVRHDKIKVNGVDEIVETPYEAHVPPDFAAQKYWLENQDQGNWSSTTKTEVTGKDGEPLTKGDGINITPTMLEKMTDEQVETLGDVLAELIKSTGDGES